jgi:sRNA-binding regulator protein Hfq
MRKSLLSSLVCVAVIATSALGDTIHLKNGSVLKGKVTSFADDQFVVMLDTGSARYLSKATVYMGDVSRIEFDSTLATAADTGSTATQPAESSPGSGIRPITEPRTDTQPRGNPSSGKSRNAQPTEQQPRETGPPDSQPAPTPVREPESTQPEKPAVTNPSPATATPVSESAEGDRLTRKPLVALKTMTVDVAARKDWTSSGLIVKRGDHIRVTASGVITLDPVSGRTCGPEGISDLADPKKLMPDQPTGALIAVISSDNDDFIFLGRAGEFTATRDGLLFLSVNEGVLSDNVGVFKAVVEVLGLRK